MTDVFGVEKWSEIMHKTRSENTKPELLVRKLFISLNTRKSLGTVRTHRILASSSANPVLTVPIKFCAYSIC